MRDIIVRYPAMDVTIAERQNDHLVIEFVKDVITACQNPKVFVNNRPNTPKIEDDRPA